MKEINDGGTAFPIQQVDMGNGPEDPQPFGMGGMSLRDYFAGQIMTGLMAYVNNDKGDFHSNSSFKNNAEYAYEQADEMIKARENG